MFNYFLQKFVSLDCDYIDTLVSKDWCNCSGDNYTENCFLIILKFARWQSFL